MNKTAYRADIDGLRAVAITPVVLFHAGLWMLAGGFTGVDVFFVISGFLITGILFRQLAEEGRISILQFYARRVARIFPSLLLVVTVTLCAGALMLSSALFEVHSLAKSSVASLGFVANFYFLVVTGDYFSPDSHGLPLLHTWSLAVEEQYYLIWPVVMVFAGVAGRWFGNLRRWCLCAVLAITVISLLSCAWLTPVNTAAAFYLPVTRAWELGLGSALALIERRPRSGEMYASAFGGLTLLVLGLFIVREGTGFPFPMALLPALGTALLIRAGQGDGSNPVSSLLSTAPFVSIGRVSYAWYLWHWPLLAFVHALTLGQASLAVKLVLALTSLMLAYATVRVVENPIRFGIARRLPPGLLVSVGVAASIAVMGLAGGVYAAARFGLLRDDPRIAAAFNDRSPLQQACLLKEFPAGATLRASCKAAAGGRVLLLSGDSHADQWAPALATWQRQHSAWAVEQATLIACPPLIGLTPTDPDGAAGQPYAACKRLNDAVSARLEAQRDVAIAVLAGNWLPRVGIEKANITTQYFDTTAHDPRTSLRLFATSLDRTLALLDTHGISAILVLQSPAPALPPAACVERLGAARCHTGLADFARKAAVVNTVIERVARRHGAQVIDPTAILCGATRCDTQIDGKIAYYDNDHVAASLAGSPRAARFWTPVLDRAAQARSH